MSLPGAVHKFSGRQHAKAAVRTHGIVVRPPFLDDLSCCSQRWEQVLVQTVVARATIEAFNEAVLLRVPDAMYCHSTPVSWHQASTA